MEKECEGSFSYFFVKMGEQCIANEWQEGISVDGEILYAKGMNRMGYMVLYGTQTGTAEDLATELQEDIQALGIECGCENVFDVEFSLLDSLEKVFVIISTWGDGDPPDDAEDFCENLSTVDAGRFEGLEYAVFALGDSGYELFCECGKQVDEKLAFAGAKAVAKRVDCDIDIDEPFREWKENLLSMLKKDASVAGV